MEAWCWAWKKKDRMSVDCHSHIVCSPSIWLHQDASSCYWIQGSRCSSWSTAKNCSTMEPMGGKLCYDSCSSTSYHCKDLDCTAHEIPQTKVYYMKVRTLSSKTGSSVSSSFVASRLMAKTSRQMLINRILIH